MVQPLHLTDTANNKYSKKIINGFIGGMVSGNKTSTW